MNYPEKSDLCREHMTRCFQPVPVISTRHLTKADGRYLLHSAIMQLVDNVVLDHLRGGGDDIYGHMLSTDTTGADDLSDELKTILEQFDTLGYRWIIFDRDGDILPDLPQYDW